MAQKHVLFIFNHDPYGSIWYTEGLRAVVGVTSGIDEHSVDAVYLGDGVNFLRKDVDRTDSAKYLGTLAKLGTRLKAEKESLDARGIKAADLAPDVDVVPRSQVVELIQKADFTIDF
ncbi:MAG: DsrE family protein [Dehalococcoidia bacterium]|nr:DsrE family protein [Dehalococcoidia bacterium]